MENEKDLASQNYGSAVSGVVGSVVMANAARTGPKWLRYFLYVCIAITLLLTGVGLIGKVGSIGSIPACDAQTTRDTLSNLNKQNKFSATKYNFIKKVSAIGFGNDLHREPGIVGRWQRRIRLSHLQGGLGRQGGDHRDQALTGRSMLARVVTSPRRRQPRPAGFPAAPAG